MRSITGKGYRESLDILTEIVPFTYVDVPTGAQAHDWTVPEEWNINAAYIKDSHGNVIIDIKDNNLHVVNYSAPVDKCITYDELIDHIHTIPDLPNAIPYVASYYNRTWGFCMAQEQLNGLKRDEVYHVYIDSSFTNGFLRLGMATIEGCSSEEVLFTSYLCHPQMINHELGGPLALCFLYQMLLATGPHYHTFRFLINPENIGSAAFLSRYGTHCSENLQAGFILNCLARGPSWTYKKSRRNQSLPNQAASLLLAHKKQQHTKIDFFPDGSDERQFCSPGYDLPIGLLMRSMFGEYPEYHTSLDDIDKFEFDSFLESLIAHYELALLLETNFKPLGTVQYGTPMLSKSKTPLYSNIMNFRSTQKSLRTRAILSILNEADGSNSLFDIASKYDLDLLAEADVIPDLITAGYI